MWGLHEQRYSKCWPNYYLEHWQQNQFRCQPGKFNKASKSSFYTPLLNYQDDLDQCLSWEPHQGLFWVSIQQVNSCRILTILLVDPCLPEHWLPIAEEEIEKWLQWKVWSLRGGGQRRKWEGWTQWASSTSAAIKTKQRRPLCWDVSEWATPSGICAIVRSVLLLDGYDFPWEAEAACCCSTRYMQRKENNQYQWNDVTGKLDKGVQLKF